MHFQTNRLWAYAYALTLALSTWGCEDAPSPEPASYLTDDDAPADPAGFTPASPSTRAAHAEVKTTLNLDDPQDALDAARGLIARPAELRVEDAEGRVLWDLNQYEFLKGEAPASVHPSLWRQAKLNHHVGLYEVTDRIYQLRGFDLANMTLIRGQSGWIVVDPLTAEQTARAAFAFAMEHLGSEHRSSADDGPLPISAVIFTHSHADHFAGILGLLSAEEAAQRQIPVIAPEGFLAEATSENILAGPTMARRSMFMFGPRLPRGPRGHVDSGLGKAPAYGKLGILPPTDVITSTPEHRRIDGLEFVFQNAPGSEAPAELTFYLPKLQAFCGAEVVSRTQHNLYTLRGAQVRDALTWSAYIDEMTRLYADAEIYFGTHHWPIWGRARILDFLEKQRDVYKFIHDQTVRLSLQGLTPDEIAETLELPAELQSAFSVRGYYGTVKHNARAVYQRYFGWFDGNPAHLDPLPATESAAKYVELMGGADRVLEQGRAAYDRGEYRWAAELLNHLVFAQPKNAEATESLARVYDQLGYQAESAAWRDTYLTGAFELRHGPPDIGFDQKQAIDLARHAPVERFLDAMAARLDDRAAEGLNMTVNLVFTDLNRSFVLRLHRSALHHRELPPDLEADATLEVSFNLYLRLNMGTAGLRETLFSDQLNVDGSRLALLRFMRLFDKPSGTFAIVTPE